MVRHQIGEESVNRKSKVKMTGGRTLGRTTEEGQDIVSGQNRLIGKRNEGGKIQLLGATFAKFIITLHLLLNGLQYPVPSLAKGFTLAKGCIWENKIAFDISYL